MWSEYWIHKSGVFRVFSLVYASKFDFVHLEAVGKKKKTLFIRSVHALSSLEGPERKSFSEKIKDFAKFAQFLAGFVEKAFVYG